MFSELNANGYDHSSLFYNAEFEEILSKIVLCYNLMIEANVLVTNDENAIRDMLLISYLKKNQIRSKIGLTNYLFDREVPEDHSIGRTDIKIQTLNTFIDTGAYYIIECKRLDNVNINGTTGLNAKYIQNGISRFAGSTYSVNNNTNGMIGFVVKELDIDQNVENLNKLLKLQSQSILTSKFLQKRKFSSFEYSYCSTHTCDNRDICLYHLMFDFSKNIA